MAYVNLNNEENDVDVTITIVSNIPIIGDMTFSTIDSVNIRNAIPELMMADGHDSHIQVRMTHAELIAFLAELVLRSPSLTIRFLIGLGWLLVSCPLILTCSDSDEEESDEEYWDEEDSDEEESDEEESDEEESDEEDSGEEDSGEYLDWVNTQWI